MSDLNEVIFGQVKLVVAGFGKPIDTELFSKPS